jgi:hypothetical protein
MRFASKLLAVAVLSSPIALTSTPARAQGAAAASPPPPCAGLYTILRISDIKPGQMKTFLDAVAAQQAWYRSHGLVDQIVLERVIDRDPQTKAAGYSETTAITDHVGYNPGADRPEDDAFKAFTALFQASSTIKTTFYTCQTK